MEPSTIQSELIKSADFQNFRKIFGPEQKINTDKELFEWFLGYIYIFNSHHFGDLLDIMKRI